MPKNRTIRRHAKRELRRIGHAPRRITPTELWQFRAITRNGRQARPHNFDGRDRFYFLPRVRGRCPRDPNRVLVCGTSAQVQRLDEDALIQRALSRGVRNPQITYCSEVGSFWAKFYGCYDFIENKGSSRPSLILATGEMRNHSYIGGETMPVEKALRHFADLHGVDFMFVEP